MCDTGQLVPIRFFTGRVMAEWSRLWTQQWAADGLNIKTVLSTYGDFHVKDKTAVRTSYL